MKKMMVASEIGAKKMMVAAVAGAMTLCGFGKEAMSPYDDVAYWFRGGNDLNGSGVYEHGSKEFIDFTRAGNPASGYHYATYASTGTKKTATGASAPAGKAIACTNVVMPYAGRSVVGMPYLHLEQPFYTNSTVTISDKEYAVGQLYANYINLPYQFQDVTAQGMTAVTNYTVFVRFRDATNWVSDVQLEHHLLQVGFSYGNKTGLAIAFVKCDTAGGMYECPKLYCGQSQVAFWNLQNKRGEWTDWVFRVTGKTVKGYVCANTKGNTAEATLLNTQSQTVTDASSTPVINLQNSKALRLGGEQAGLSPCYTNGVNGLAWSSNQGEAIGNTAKAYRGDIATVAVWTRALSDDEVRLVMSERRPTLVQMGLANGASTEFTGEDAVADASGLRPEKWNPVLNAAHPTQSVKFTVYNGEQGVSQYLRIRPVAGSVAAKVAVTLDGKHLGEKVLDATEDALFHVKASFLTQGQHTLVFTRTDGGAGDYTIDAFTLAGSWRVGTGGEHGGMEHESNYAYMYKNPRTYHLSDGNLKHFARGFTGSATSDNATHYFPFDIPADLIGKMRDAVATFELKEGIEDADYSFEYFINGTSLGTRTVKRWATVTFTVPASQLKAGRNELKIVKTGGGAWINCSVYTLSLGRLIDGSILILR